jgi:ankyrin repeat protein
LILSGGGGWLEATKLLLAKGADPSLKDNEGNSALSLARANFQRETAELLEKAGPTSPKSSESPAK